MKSHRIATVLCLLAALTFTGCAGFPASRGSQPTTVVSAPAPITDYHSFKTQPDYPRTSESYRNEEVFSRTDASNSSVLISISLQRAFLMNGDEVALDYPVSTGKASHPTPAGNYTILEKISDKRSNRYGQVHDASGNVVNADADSRFAEIPPGGRFVGAAMPYWMRLTWSGIGMHVGEVPRYAASHACIRGQADVVPAVFSKVRIGTPVTILN
tara:strand:+ start:12505 stop:13146 length:642 start_codon:yes stop_codon:yes gene_type:complete